MYLHNLNDSLSVDRNCKNGRDNYHIATRKSSYNATHQRKWKGKSRINLWNKFNLIVTRDDEEKKKHLIRGLYVYSIRKKSILYIKLVLRNITYAMPTDFKATYRTQNPVLWRFCGKTVSIENRQKLQRSNIYKHTHKMVYLIVFPWLHLLLKKMNTIFKWFYLHVILSYCFHHIASTQKSQSFFFKSGIIKTFYHGS